MKQIPKKMYLSLNYIFIINENQMLRENQSLDIIDSR